MPALPKRFCRVIALCSCLETSLFLFLPKGRPRLKKKDIERDINKHIWSITIVYADKLR